MKKFEELTEKERADICNGCGGKGGWIVPPYAAMNEANCNHHDYGYWKGGGVWARLVCDCKFWWALQKDSLAFGWKNPHKVVWFTGWAAIYFLGVRVAGWKYFNYKKRLSANVSSKT
jgi:hypothetical protein